MNKHFNSSVNVQEYRVIQDSLYILMVSTPRTYRIGYLNWSIQLCYEDTNVFQKAKFQGRT